MMLLNELIFTLQSILLATGAVLAAAHSSTALTIFMCLCALLGNLLITKQIDIAGFTVTGCDAYTIGCAIALNFLQEYYGSKKAFQAIWLSFGSLIFFTFATQFHLLFEPSITDVAHHHLSALFSSSPRIIFASLIAYCISQYVDQFLYSYLKKKFSSSSFFNRFYLSALVSQAVDTALFTYLGLYGIASHLFHIFFVSYVIKIATIALIGPLSFLAFFIKTRLSNHHESTV